MLFKKEHINVEDNMKGLFNSFCSKVRYMEIGYVELDVDLSMDHFLHFERAFVLFPSFLLFIISLFLPSFPSSLLAAFSVLTSLFSLLIRIPYSPRMSTHLSPHSLTASFLPILLTCLLLFCLLILYLPPFFISLSLSHHSL